MKYKANNGIQSTRFEKALVVFAAAVITIQLIAFVMVMANTPIGVSLSQWVVKP